MEKPLARPQSLLEVFVAFTLLALQGFGGVLAVSQDVLCERKRWLSPAQYVETLSLCQVLPGPNVCNLALVVGDRFFGWRGAFAALAGLVAAPFVIVLSLAVVYSHFAALPAVTGALRGMGAAAAGLIIGSGLKLLPSLRGNAMGTPGCVFFLLAAFAAAALLRLPLAWTVPAVGAFAWVYAWRHTGAAP